MVAHGGALPGGEADAFARNGFELGGRGVVALDLEAVAAGLDFRLVAPVSGGDGLAVEQHHPVARRALIGADEQVEQCLPGGGLQVRGGALREDLRRIEAREAGDALVDIRLLESITSPVAAGILKPVVFVPPVWQQWPQETRA